MNVCTATPGTFSMSEMFIYHSILSPNPHRFVFHLFSLPAMYQILALLDQDLVLNNIPIMLQKDTILKVMKNECQNLWNSKHIPMGRFFPKWRRSPNRPSFTIDFPFPVGVISSNPSFLFFLSISSILLHIQNEEKTTSGYLYQSNHYRKSWYITLKLDRF